MGIEAKTVKQRKCDGCGESFEMTAQQLKDHYNSHLKEKK